MYITKFTNVTLYMKEDEKFIEATEGGRFPQFGG